MLKGDHYECLFDAREYTGCFQSVMLSNFSNDHAEKYTFYARFFVAKVKLFLAVKCAFPHDVC